MKPLSAMSTTVSNFPRKRHNLQGRGTKQVSRTNISEKLGVVRLRRRQRVSPPWALR